MANASSRQFERLIIVSYRLPFKTAETGQGKVIEQSSGGLVSSMLSLSQRMKAQGGDGLHGNTLWVGKADGPLEDYEFINARRRDFTLVPVALQKEIDERYYGGFCNDLIWPLFHYFPSLVVMEERNFESYRAANDLFAERLRTLVRPGDFVWIHDYHLFLLPALLREEFPVANIGFFLHIPFPTFEVFRVLPRRWREAMLKGVLGSDVVGFHTWDYSQYFVRTVSRLLGAEVTMNTVALEDRVVRVDAFPLGIDYAKFSEAARGSKEVEEERARIRTNLQDRKLVLSIDRLDYSKGLLQRLAAFEHFLEEYPHWINRVVFNMIVVPSRETIPRYQEMKREVEATVGRINGRFGTIGWMPIIYQYKSLSFEELIALYGMSNVGLITPIRDGMNLVAKEYVACQGREPGVLVLSEMAGAAADLSEALLVNPTDRREVAEALNIALSMPLRERAVIMGRLQRRIKSRTVFTWARDFLEGLKSIKEEQELRKVNLIAAQTEAEIIERYTHAMKRVIFIDYDGTLVPFATLPELAVPGKETIDRLRSLSENPRNSLVLISGRDKAFMEEWFSGVNVYCIAEHGAYQRDPGGPWKSFVDSDQEWKDDVLPVLQRYADRCNGSFIEEKSSSLVWHYRNATPEIGALRAKELIEELRALASHANRLHALEGRKAVEIKRSGYDKGVAASRFVANGAFDFIMALGDDRTDEDVFSSLPPEAVTIKVGMTPSLAKYNLRNQREVSRLIARLIESELV